MHIVITSYETAVNIDFGDFHDERKQGRIRKSSVQEVIQDKDDKTIELVFNSGEIESYSYIDIEDINGSAPTSQIDLFNKLNAIFGFDA